MKGSSVLVTVALLVSQISASGSAIWPQPIQIQTGNETIWLDNALAATFRCGKDEGLLYSVVSPSKRISLVDQLKQGVVSALSTVQEWIRDQNPDFEGLSEHQIVRSAVHETLKYLHREKLVPWKFHKRHSQFEPESADTSSLLSSLTISQANCPSTAFDPNTFFDGDESYELVICNSTASIISTSSLGTLRALESFKQLFYAHSSGSGVYTPLAPVHMFDQPYWRHRGLSLDIARNAFPAEDVMRAIDAMAACKLSRLHLHATDSQSWPIEIPSLPDLAAKGAYQPHLVWSVKDLESVQSYGAARGIMVFLELDMPGHTASIAHAYPDLVAAFNELDWSTFAAEPQSGQLKLNSEKVRAFLDTLLTDLLPRVKPYSQLYHFGGDELNPQVHLLDETVQSNETTILQPLVQNILNQVAGHAVKHGLRPMVWEEMVLDWNLTVPTSMADTQQRTPLVQVWRDSEHIEQVLQMGHTVIFGDSKHWYLDCGFGQFLDPFPSGSSPPGVPINTSGGVPSRLDSRFLDYCSPYHNWRAVYVFNPLDSVSKHLHQGIEGGEVLMWSEQTDPIDLDFKLWPRTAAAAEVLWSGPRKREQIADATWRLGHFRERLVQNYGISSSPVQMTWCLMEGGCEY